MQYEKYLKMIDEKADVFCGISDRLWDDAELSFEEYKAAQMLTEILEKEGFTVTRGVGGIPTSFTATFGLDRGAVCAISDFTTRLVVTLGTISDAPREIFGS